MPILTAYLLPTTYHVQVTDAQVEARFERPQFSDEFVMEVSIQGKLRLTKLVSRTDLA